MKGVRYAGVLALVFAFSASLVNAGEGWMTDFKAAQKESAKRGVPILADFSGSDWCGWCIKLDKEVFQDAAFKKFAGDNFVLFLADFPRSKPQPKSEKDQNQELAKKYGIQGFPTVLLLDAEGKVVKRTGYLKGGAATYIEHLKESLPAKPQPQSPPPPPAPGAAKSM